MTEETETTALLREIRDLQRAHFEQYKQFTAAALQRQDEAMRVQQQSAAAAAQARESNAAFRAEVQHYAAHARQFSSRAWAIAWVVSAGLNAVLVFVLVYVILVLRLER